MAAKVASPFRLVWSPLPPQRDGSTSSSSSATSSSPSKGLRLNMRVQRPAHSTAAAPAASALQKAAESSTPSPRSSMCTLLLRGFASLLQLLPQFLYRCFFQQSLPYLTFSVAASLLCFLSLNIPGSYLMLCAVLGLVAFTILSLSAYTTGAYVATASSAFAHAATVPTHDPATPPPPLPPHFSSGASVPLRRHRSAGELPLNFKPKATAPARSSEDGSSSTGGSSSSSSGLSLRQRRLLRRQQTAVRMTSLETVPEALAAEHPAPATPAGQLSRPASSGFLLAVSSAAASEAPLSPAGVVGGTGSGAQLRALLTADGLPVSDLQLAACVSHLSAGLDGTTAAAGSILEAPFALTAGDGSGLDRSAPNGGGGITNICRVDSSDSIASSVAAAAAKTMVGRAYELGERMWPWVTVPVAVACLPVAVVCTLPVAVPLLCTYGAVRIGVSVVRAGASAVCDYVPGAKTAA